MNAQELIALIDRLRGEPRESEWLEFKENHYEPQALGEYLSALANAACVSGKSRGYLVFGIQDGSHRVVGTSFDPYGAKKGNQELMLWLSMGLQPNVGFESHIVEHPQGRVVLFEVGPAWDRPVRFYGTAHIRIGTSKTELSKHPEKERAIWTHHTDWSGQICEGATLDDLDPEALTKAREQFRIKHPGQALLITEWDEATFLNKAKLAVRGTITHAALLLLGREETATLISPGVAKISWILKDGQNRELDYEHFGPPFVLAVDRLLGRIRNLTVRALPSGTLFPQEINQYDPWVIREALHNCIAHQDYNLRGRINVVEMPDSVLLTNMGSFLPGDIETVIRQDAPLEIYRNPFLAAAMVALNMIDTQGGGIKRMFELQRQRFFPLPDYDLSKPDTVAVRLPGRIMDEHYTRLLMDRSDLNLWQVMLLDRVQKRSPISHEAHRWLKSAGLVEGRYPNLIIAGAIAKLTGQKARHIKDRGLAKEFYLEMIVALVKEHGPVSREEIDLLLMDKLPDALHMDQKKHKIHNLLSELVRSQVIENIGNRAKPKWRLTAGK